MVALLFGVRGVRYGVGVSMQTPYDLGIARRSLLASPQNRHTRQINIKQCLVKSPADPRPRLSRAGARETSARERFSTVSNCTLEDLYISNSRPRDHRELRLDIITSLNLNITGSLPARVGTTRAMPQIMALEAMPNFSSALQLAKTSDKPSAACPAHATADLIQ